MFIFYRFLLMLIVYFSFTYASTTYFSGYIYNSTGQALEGANIIAIDSNGSKVGTSSAEGGYFKTLEWKKPLILNQFNDELEMISQEN